MLCWSAYHYLPTKGARHKAIDGPPAQAVTTEDMVAVEDAGVLVLLGAEPTRQGATPGLHLLLEGL